MIPFFATVEYRKLKEVTHAGVGVAVCMDGLVGPFARQTELAPGADVVGGWTRSFAGPLVSLVTPGPLRPKNAVYLLHRELGQRIVFVDEDDDGPRPSLDVEGASRYCDSLQVVLERFIE